jgi:hypothetical protein
MVTWEYKTLKQATGGFVGGKLDVEELDAVLNKYGSAGWEVVSAFDTNQSNGASRDVIVILKRPHQP